MSDSKIQYKDIFHQSPLAKMLIAVDSNNICSFADINSVAVEYFALTADDVIDKNFTELFSEEMAEHFEQSCQTCIRTKRPVLINALPHFPGGVKVQSFMLNPIFDDKKKINFINIVARPEATDINQLEQERDDAILLLTSLFDAGGMGIIVTDEDGTIVRVNDTFLSDYNWEREDLLGREFTVIIPAEDHNISKKLHRAFIERGRSGSREINIMRKDGKIADVILTTVLLEMSQKKCYMVSTIKDITERKNMIRNLKRAKEQADAANKAKSAFLANMSHELRTPLNAIIGFSEMIMNETFGLLNNDKYKEYMTDIHFSARHLLDIINDVLDMSKIEAGKIELIEREVIVADVFRSVSIIMHERAEDAGVKLIFDLEEDLPNIRADQRLLRQILINLTSNSIKFSPIGEKVTVKAHRLKDNHIRISVSDNGCGIPEDKIQVVLEPFGQINDPIYSQGQGTGLGLPLAKAMVELHGGKLDIASKEGKGTRVSLDFPVERTVK